MIFQIIKGEGGAAEDGNLKELSNEVSDHVHLDRGRVEPKASRGHCFSLGDSNTKMLVACLKFRFKTLKQLSK